MTIDINDKAAVEKAMWSEIEESRFGMLAPAGSDEHFQPMTAFAEPESGKLWFYTRADSDLALAAGSGTSALFVFMAKDQKMQASIRGELRVSLDALHRDKYWSSVVSAWFAKGKDDPHLTMLCLACQEAQVWLSDKGGLKFGWEIAKANLTGGEPDVGGRASLKLG
ncbi:MAG: pyridoxamine 5'-phosphate oxidase family protein [Caulobacteraceae bacterium]